MSEEFFAPDANCEECGAPCMIEYAHCAKCAALDWGTGNGPMDSEPDTEAHLGDWTEGDGTPDHRRPA